MKNNHLIALLWLAWGGTGVVAVWLAASWLALAVVVFAWWVPGKGLVERIDKALSA